MLTRFFRRQPLLDASSIAWQYEVFGWALRHFGTDIFQDETILVLPSNAHFPGRANSIPEMARLIFQQVQQHAGLAHWPCRVVDPGAFDPETRPRLVIQGALRGSRGIVPTAVSPAERLTVTYDPDMVRNPEALIGTYAHTLAHYLAALAQEAPPGGEANWPHATELLAVFMGFGVILANSAFNVPTRQCGACQGPASDRASYLSQYDITYALAIFCALKGIAPGAVTPHLKSSLRGFFRKAMKQVVASDDLERLRAIDRPLPLPEPV